jgi:general secretion pathway protein N
MAGFSFRNRRLGWSKGAAALTTRWLESTLEVARWENVRRAGRRWGWSGAGCGALLGLIAYAHAPWLAKAVLLGTDGRMLLADAQGTIWRGDAVAVLTGGPGSRDARSLPGRLNWSMRPTWRGLSLVLQQDCCIQSPLVLQIQPAWSGAILSLGTQPLPGQPLQSSGEIGQWPAAWLGGMGTPWNTLQLSGVLRVSIRDLAFAWTEGRLRVSGQAEVALDNVASRITTLERLGSYRLDVLGDPEGQLQLNLGTLDGALSLTGSGGIVPSGLRFRGEARASEDTQGALDNLLNIIGRREGDRSVISIG